VFLEHADDLRARPLRRRDLDPDPLRQFRAWFQQAEERGVALPEAAALATASRDGKPSARMVLLKGLDERGFVFHTGYGSRKSRDLADNPRAALLVHWPELGRQVRVEGRVDRVPRKESEAYFRTRPRGGQLAAWASRQSEPIESRDELERRFQALEARYAAAEPPLPEHWGGFRLAPDEYEFWQHRENRLHDRFRYRRHDTHSTLRGGRGRAERLSGESEWLIERLQP
jgi:pyridoxamine 5'-phosphate oxidase